MLALLQNTVLLNLILVRLSGVLGRQTVNGGKLSWATIRSRNFALFDFKDVLLVLGMVVEVFFELTLVQIRFPERMKNFSLTAGKSFLRFSGSHTRSDLVPAFGH